MHTNKPSTSNPYQLKFTYNLGIKEKIYEARDKGRAYYQQPVVIMVEMTEELELQITVMPQEADQVL